MACLDLDSIGNSELDLDLGLLKMGSKNGGEIGDFSE